MSDDTGPRKRKARKKQAKWKALDVDGRERPRFLRDFPRQAELDQLVSAFEAGNFALVREQAPKLAREAEDPKVRRAAAQLFERIKPDPLLKYLLLLSFLLLVYLTLFAYLGHAH